MIRLRAPVVVRVGAFSPSTSYIAERALAFAVPTVVGGLFGSIWGLRGALIGGGAGAVFGAASAWLSG